MSRHTRDGRPLAHGSTADRITGKFGGFSIAGTIECVVDKAYYPDDTANTSKKYMEYSVVNLTTKTVIPTVRQLVEGGGYNNGDYLVLAETTGTVDNPSDPSFDRAKVDSTKWNGDRVLVAFVGGNQNVPVILGVLPHAATKYGRTRKDGVQRLVSWNGSTFWIDKDGSLFIKLKDGKTVNIDTGDKGVVTVKGGPNSSASFVIKDDGEIDIQQASGKMLNLGGNNFPLSDTKQLFQALTTWITALDAALLAGTQGGPTAQTLTAYAAAGTAATQALLKLLGQVPGPLTSQFVNGGD